MTIVELHVQIFRSLGGGGGCLAVEYEVVVDEAISESPILLENKHTQFCLCF